MNTSLPNNQIPQCKHLSSMLEKSPTVFSIMYATIVGRACKSIFAWRLERGANIGTLDLLAGSTSLPSAVVTHATLRLFTVISPALILIWALSPVGSQASLRVAAKSISTTTVPHEYIYMTQNATFEVETSYWYLDCPILAEGEVIPEVEFNMTEWHGIPLVVKYFGDKFKMAVTGHPGYANAMQLYFVDPDNPYNFGNFTPYLTATGYTDISLGLGVSTGEGPDAANPRNETTQGNATTTTSIIRDNQYVVLSPVGSAEDASTTAREFKGHRVMYGDVQPIEPVGHLAIASTDSGYPIGPVQRD
ncbi:heterokaryon incompatibility protein-domain-containing protein, partial [Apiospora saccharicola]